MKKTTLVLTFAAIAATSVAAAEYTTNDWAAARAQWKAARVAWTNEMAKAAAAGLVPPRKARAAGVKSASAVPRVVNLKSNAALTKKQADYFKSRRICVKRDTNTLPGYVITHWHRNGKPDTKGPAVVTNRLQKIIGAEQKNPIQELADRNRMLAEEWKASAEKWRIAATNNAARVERVTAALDDRRAEYVEKRDAAVLPSTKAIYQAFIDAIDRIKERMKIEDGDN